MENSESQNVKGENSNQDMKESDNKQSGNIPNSEKKRIIDLMFVKKIGTTLSRNFEQIKAFPLYKEAEKAFADEVYANIKKMGIGEDVNQIVNANQIIAELYAMCQIPREFVESVKQENKEKGEEFKAKIAAERRDWDEREERAKKEREERAKKEKEARAKKENEKNFNEETSGEKVENDEGEEITENTENIKYKENLYQPGALCGHLEESPDRPYVKHIKYTPEAIEDSSPKTSYQFANRNYTIKEVGSLVYMPTPNLKDNITEYEITISRDDISTTIRRFGNISFRKMNDAAYSSVVFLGLLGQDNITDKELQGYIGSIEQVSDENGNLKNQYRVVHSPEEYTAVVTLNEIEKEAKRKAKEENNKADEPAKDEDER